MNAGAEPIQDGRFAKGAATRAKLLDAAGELLELHGYAGTGLNEIIARSGAPKGSLYHHFPGGKAELVAAAVTHVGRERAEEIEQVLEGCDSTAEAARLIVDAFATRLEESNFQVGCPIAPVTLDCADPAVREACGGVYADWTRLIAGRLKDDGLAHTAADELAELALVLIEGALVVSRAERDRGPLDRVVGHLDRLLTLPR